METIKVTLFPIFFLQKKIEYSNCVTYFLLKDFFIDMSVNMHCYSVYTYVPYDILPLVCSLLLSY